MKFEGPGPTEKKEKPKFLYHASPHRAIEELEPRQESVRDITEGPRIFATPDQAFATVFLIAGNDKWTQSGIYNGVPHMIICAERDIFIKEDEGGAVYQLPNDGFACDLTKGLGKNEWTCQQNVKPVGKKEFPSALDAMIDNGIQVYFVDKETFTAIKQDKEFHGMKIIENIQSENQLRNKNVRSFESSEA